ncbi:MAG: hypothetical protein H0T68_07865 [Gemmatimonadales bacterium]|nr:hypothetical protein [Gemmatimonadales bacterium]
MSDTGRLDIVLFTTSRIGVELAARLVELAEVRSLTVVTTVIPQTRGIVRRVRRTLRLHGPAGLARFVAGRLRRKLGFRTKTDLGELLARRCPGVRRLHCPDLHAPESIEQLRVLAPDLGVVFGCYKLRPSVFAVPRLGSVNLHLGRAPEFRGSSPGFYEMLEGVPEVGVTVHWVSEALDGGDILLQETFPLELAPPGDPLKYLRRYRLDVLVPQGERMMAQVVAAIARGPVSARVQDHARARARRQASWRLQRELRRRVAERRLTFPGNAS